MYNYVARNPVTGQKVKAQVQADNDRAAAKLIQEQGLAPLSITLQKKVGNNIFDKVRTKDRVLFARQLSTLVSAGLPLVQSLRIVQKQSTSKSMQMILNEVINDIEAGKGFGVSLEKHPQVFSKVFTSLVSAGEASGTLDTTLERLANQQEKDAEIGSKIRGAFVYPIIVIIVMLAVVGFMIVTVLPQVKTLYDGIQGGATLPFITRVLLVVADVVTNFWWVFAILIALTVAFGSKWARTLGGKRVIDKMKMRAPIISNLYMKMYMARFSHTGSTLVASGVPLIQMLEITAASIDNIYIEESI
ncbi:MAG: type II secretion system F family protein, partial [Candidatus Saccharibacteria bacterium]